MKYSHEEYDAAIRRATGEYSHEEYDKAIKNAVKGGSSDRYAEYDKAIRNALKGGGSDSHEEYDRAIKAAIESQRQYSHEEYDKAIARALGVNGNKNNREKKTENILTSVRKSDSLEEEINSDSEDDHITWVTVKGTHVPLDGDGNVIGGALEGQNFSEAKSEGSSGEGTAKRSEPSKTPEMRTETESKGSEESGKQESETEKTGGEEFTAKTATGIFGGRTPEEFSSDVRKAKESLAKSQENKEEKTSWRVSNLSSKEIEDDHPGAILHTTERGSTVAVDGEHDIFAVCVNPDEGEHGLHGKDPINMALKQGGDRLDSFAGNHGFYTKLGFEPVSWCKFDLKYAPPDWKEEYTEEPVIFYKYTGNRKAQGKEELEKWLAKTPPKEDYTAAKEARDNIMANEKNEEK